MSETKYLLLYLLIIFFLFNVSQIFSDTSNRQYKPFNGKCDRSFIEKNFGFEDFGYRVFNKDIKEPLFIQDCPKEHDNLKDSYQVTYGHVVINNSQYFRWNEFESSENYNASYLILGDSTSWGVGMSVNSTYPYLLQKKVKNKNIIVNSLTLPGAPLESHYKNLKQYIEFLKPSHIIISMYHNDIESTEKPLYYYQYEKFSSYLEFLNSIKLNNISFVIRKLLIKNSNWIYLQDKAYKDKSSFHWINFKNNLIKIKKLAQEYNIEGPIIMLMNGPYEQKIIDFNKPPDGYKLWLSWYDEIRVEACNQGYYVFDNVESIIKELNNKKLTVNDWDYHPGEDLHKLYFKNLLFNINIFNNIKPLKKYC